MIEDALLILMNLLNILNNRNGSQNDHLEVKMDLGIDQALNHIKTTDHRKRIVRTKLTTNPMEFFWMK